MAQFGRALRSGRRGCGFKSRHLDQKRAFIFLINARNTLLLVSFMVLNIENFDSAELFSLCFSLLEFMISFIEFIGGVSMFGINIVVEIGYYGGKPNDRVKVSKLQAIPLKELGDKPSGFESRTLHQNDWKPMVFSRFFFYC